MKQGAWGLGIENQAHTQKFLSVIKVAEVGHFCNNLVSFTKKMGKIIDSIQI